jgi:membrane protein implicated in regulation of membrane protease activity
MCHVLLLLPVLALPVLWLWPPAIAWPVYGVATAASLGIYALVYWAWKAPLAHGSQTLLGATGRVVDVEGRRVTLRVRGELWLAEVRGGPPELGEEAEVVAIDGLRLTVRRLNGARIGH